MAAACTVLQGEDWKAELALPCPVGSLPIKMVVVMPEWYPGNKAHGKVWVRIWPCVYSTTFIAAEVCAAGAGHTSCSLQCPWLTTGPESSILLLSTVCDRARARFTCISDISVQSADHSESPRESWAFLGKCYSISPSFISPSIKCDY